MYSILYTIYSTLKIKMEIEHNVEQLLRFYKITRHKKSDYHTKSRFSYRYISITFTYVLFF